MEDRAREKRERKKKTDFISLIPLKVVLTCLSNLKLVAGEYFYIVGMLVLIFLQEMMIMLTEEPRTLLPPPSPPLSWLRQERGERMHCDFSPVSSSRIIITPFLPSFPVLAMPGCWAGQCFSLPSVFAKLIQCK